MPASQWLRGLARYAALCGLVTVCVAAMFVLPSEWRGWQWLAINLAIGALFSFQIGGLTFLATAVVAPRVRQWAPVARWSALMATMAAAAVAGTLLSVLELDAFGFGSRWPFYGRSLRIGVPVALITGILVTVFKRSRERLQAAELALRTQQLERERAEKLAAEARLASLTSRVEPHFLFNTLNSIAALVRQDPERAEETIERLSGLLRGSLDRAPLVPLDREMKLVSDYLHIQHTRLGDRLRFTVDWPTGIGVGTTVPPFAVQNLVENAVKHVGSRRIEGVDVRISAARSATDVVIDVTDNGPGFDAQAIRSGHGLDNLVGRLRALYGDRGRLVLERRDTGMTVRLVVPA